MLGAVDACTRKAVTSLEVTLAGDSAADVAFRIGFAAATLTAEPADGVGTDTGIICCHDGLKAGSGFIKEFKNYRIGVAGEELRITCTTPTTGSLKVVIGQFDLVK